jgi:polar amino acid transport system substrate-binding protein
MTAFLILLLLTSTLLGQERPETTPTPSLTPALASGVIRVGVAGSPPFVVKVGKDLEGMSVETWRALAEELDLEYELVDVKSVEDLLRGVHDGDFDVGVGPISITSERSTFVAFSQPYYNSSLGLLSLDRRKETKKQFRLDVLNLLIGFSILVAILAFVGCVCWFLERKANPEQFPMSPLSGVGNGMWMALVTMTTVGYGDRAPVTTGGRIFTGIWMLVTTVTLSSFTAWLATTYTVSKLENTTLNDASQLVDRPVAVVAGTTSEVFARHFGSRLVMANDYLDAIERLQSDSVDAVVYDYPVLRYYLDKHPELPVYLAESTFALQDYGFAVDREDDRLHRLNVGLLRLAESGVLREIRQHWFRSRSENRIQ